MSHLRALSHFFVAIIAFSALPSPAQADPIPAELLDDPHFRSEFGLNDVTTPSIRQVFAMVKNLAPLSRNSLNPSIARPTPLERTDLALSLGGLIADGFFLIQAHQVDDLQTLAQSIADHCSALGTGDRVTRHAKALLEGASRGSWEFLENELASTQREVEGELVALRDVGAVHLISLGGWIRAFEVATALVETDFTPERAAVLRRIDVAEYFFDTLQYLEPDVQERPSIRSLSDHLRELLTMLAPVPGNVDLEWVHQLRAQAVRMSAAAFGPSR